jgi:hypothetical protein
MGINVPRNKAIILRRNKRDRINNSGILKPCKGKKLKKKPIELAMVPRVPVTGENKDFIILLKM